MRIDRNVGLVALVVGLGFAPRPSEGGDSPAEKALKERGLTRTAGVYVLDSEKPVLAGLKGAKAAHAAYAAIAERRATAEEAATRLVQVEEHKAELSTHLADLNQRIIEQGAQQAVGPSRQAPGGAGGRSGMAQLINERDQVKETVAELAGQAQSLKAEVPPAPARATLDEEVKKKEAAFKSSLADLRPQVDAVTRSYADLAADASVKGAIVEVKKSTGLSVKLGPSAAFLAAVRELDQAERKFLDKRPPAAPKKKAKAKK